MKSCAKFCLKNHCQDKMIKEKRCPRKTWNYSSAALVGFGTTNNKTDPSVYKFQTELPPPPYKSVKTMFE